MELNHNSDLYQQFTPEEETQRPDADGGLARPLRQNSDLGMSNTLRMQWIPPLTRTEWNKWGGTSKDFALIFSFWTKWTQKHCDEAVKVHIWTQVLALFIRYGGAAADFLQQYQFVGMAAYKLRTLSNFMLLSQHQEATLKNLNFSNNTQDKWLESFPPETAFLDNMFFIPKWDLSEAIVKLQILRVEARLANNVNSQIMRINPTEFCESVGQAASLDLQNGSVTNGLSSKVSCITDFSLKK